MEDFIRAIPKAELHLHIEGTLEPELMFQLADRNRVPLRYKNIEQLRDAYHFNDLQAFLDIYYQCSSVLLFEQDFYELMYAYLARAAQQNIRYSEIFFDPQTHTQRGIAFDVFMAGFIKAIADAGKNLGIQAKLIMCFLRDLSEESAIATLAAALPFREHILAVGLDSAELGNPPEKFVRAFAEVRRHGFPVTVHAGEEGPAEYIWQALKLLEASRIDHGVHCVDDPSLVDFLLKKQIPLTMCPLSNLKLNVVKDLKHHPLKHLLECGLFVTVNSDDPAFLGGYLVDNFIAIQKAQHLTKQEIFLLVKNAFVGSFLSHHDRQRYLNELDSFFIKNVA